ncbi:endo-1,3(4)-beta-glucanase-like protein [Sistotremastrum niveocremeum HHB9708]|uniref:Endo-1,3(4)-beta-glucanase-like protein n=1 Tax=Sistotremastrum niveocremeum HHB9708 TaxID=1314777 RepID=A0A164MQL0_9AGAM|nr:endo-1,3(4)-beta-glucanase-like protein [Sistotremastrum niveocremeum HHB9708]
MAIRKIITFLALVISHTRATTYRLSENWVGHEFFDGFAHENIADPTHGRVTYVDEATARSDNLSYAIGDSFVIRADYTSVLAASDPGRNSVRLKSKTAYTTHVVAFDIRHIPQGCATWPAAWETDDNNWPNAGEADIIEGVNDVSPNQGTLHTTAGCVMPSGIQQTGAPQQLDCNYAVNYNAGCGVKVDKANSYGPSFNNIGGGYYAMERTPDFIRMWFWPRNDTSAPIDMKTGKLVIDTDSWGEPFGYWPSGPSCNLAAHFGPNNIIINLTLCGDWAGAVFNNDGCPGNCVDYVNNNPSAFRDAYWEFKAARVYLPGVALLQPDTEL